MNAETNLRNIDAIFPEEAEKQKDRINILSFLFKLTNLTKPKLMKINVSQIYDQISSLASIFC